MRPLSLLVLGLGVAGVLAVGCGGGEGSSESGAQPGGDAAGGGQAGQAGGVGGHAAGAAGAHDAGAGGGGAAGSSAGGSGGAGASAGAGGTAGKPAAGAGGKGGGGAGSAGKAGGPPALPVCDCFVKEAWCGAGVAKEAEKRGCSVPLLPAHADDILACPGGEWGVKESCDKGCVEAAAGTADTCKLDPCDFAAVKDAPYIKYGLHPDASDALAAIGLDAGDISQTIGSASASAGTHAKDGAAEGKDYSAATDLRVVGLSQAQIKDRLEKLASVGFVAWYRWPGHDGWPSDEAPHIHAVWVGAKMKLSLRDQVRDWVAGKNGLASHTKYTFYTWKQCRIDAIWQRYLEHNPAQG